MYSGLIDSVDETVYFQYSQRWRLQSAFFKNIGLGGFAGIPLVEKLFCWGPFRGHSTLLGDLKQFEDQIPHCIFLNGEFSSTFVDALFFHLDRHIRYCDDSDEWLEKRRIIQSILSPNNT